VFDRERIKDRVRREKEERFTMEIVVENLEE